MGVAGCGSERRISPGASGGKVASDNEQLWSSVNVAGGRDRGVNCSLTLKSIM